MKAESILFLLSIHEGNELRDQMPGGAYDELAIAGLVDGTDITEKGYAYVRQLEAVDLPVQMWVDPRSFVAGNDANWAAKTESMGEIWDAFTEYQKRQKDAHATPTVASGAAFDRPIEIKAGGITMTADADDAPPAGYNANPGALPPGVDRASDISIVRANGKRKTLPAQTINWADKTTPDRVIGWRYAAAGAEARIHTPGETMPAPDPSVQ